MRWGVENKMNMEPTNLAGNGHIFAHLLKRKIKEETWGKEDKIRPGRMCCVCTCAWVYGTGRWLLPISECAY